MGMAASQARYLALVARQSNCEFEGQQINQSRLILANQTANLFNQMLGLNVPVPPSTQDYTKTQYSYTDGLNSSVIDSWKQLSKADPEYNYVVKTHYYTDVYTGSVKMLSDPQVQISHAGNPIASQAEIETALRALKLAEDEMNSKYDHWQSVKKTQENVIADIKQKAQANVSRTVNSDLQYANVPPAGSWGDVYTFAESATDAYRVTVYNDPNDGAAGAADKENAHKILKELENMINLGITSIDKVNADLMEKDPSFFINDISQIHQDDEADPNDYVFSEKQLQVLQTYGLMSAGTATITASDPADITNFVASTGNDVAQYLVLTKDLSALATSVRGGTIGAIGGYPIDLGYNVDNTFHDTTYYMDQIQSAQDVIDSAEQAYIDQKTIYNNALDAYNALSQPTYIGNCPVTYLLDLTDDQKTELQQVVKDMKAQNISTDILNHFDEDGNYLGGVYSFDLNGVTYYTTYDNLINAYASNRESNNDIDAQYKLPYYNASYISTRIDKESKALLETDGNGRFSSIRFEDDSVTYTLNVETITDDAAYQDAMNKYLYENAMYDKAVQDINAKTSIIHRQDQELELRLKQLDTERQALKEEVAAVKGVIKDNIGESFKTFSN